VKKHFALLVVALCFAFAVTPAFSATVFNYSFTSGALTATGTLTGDLVAPGEFSLTSGTLTLTGVAFSGTGFLVPDTLSPAAETNTTLAGGGTFITYDDFLFTPGPNQLDDNGLLFEINGTSFAIWGDGGGVSEGFYSNYVFDGRGTFSANVASPEPGTMMLLGAGLLGLGLIRRRTQA
jgi:PEP-CTERM motif